MKKINKGFTLAEVLFALAIIGIVAAMTLPSIQASFFKQQVATGLAKAINTLENANALALQENNAKDLRELTTSSSYYDIISKHIKSSSITSIKLYTTPLYPPSGGTLTTIASSSPSFKTNDNITFIQPSLTLGTSTNSNLSKQYSGKYYVIYVDVNGNNKPPNYYGKDLYQLYVDTKGRVIPSGGMEYRNYTNTTYGWETNCKLTTGYDPWSCAGSIVDNGYKVIHF